MSSDLGLNLNLNLPKLDTKIEAPKSLSSNPVAAGALDQLKLETPTLGQTSAYHSGSPHLMQNQGNWLDGLKVGNNFQKEIREAKANPPLVASEAAPAGVKSEVATAERDSSTGDAKETKEKKAAEDAKKAVLLAQTRAAEGKKLVAENTKHVQQQQAADKAVEGDLEFQRAQELLGNPV